MNNIEKRIEKLEERTGAAKQLIITIRCEGDKTEPTEEQKKAAIAAFKAKNPDWKEGDWMVLTWEDGQYV